MGITLESHLKEVSEKDGNKLYSNWIVIKEELSNKLETVSSYFQHFSLHNSTHSNEICNNIERFLGEERIKKLSATDTWLLLMSFYSHDLGMALKYNDIVNEFEGGNFKEELKELVNGSNEELKEAAERVLAFEKENSSLKPLRGKVLDIFRDVQLIIEEHYRKGHARRSADYIEKFLDEKYSTINSRMIELLKKICLAHQEDIKNIEELHYEENGLFQDYVHPRFVAGMLCLGDLLDMDTNRFSKYGLEAASTLGYESELHLKKHKALKHFLIKPNGIEIEMDSPSMDVHRIARDWVQWIDETIDYLTLKWSCIAPKDFGNPPKITYKKLLIKGSNLFNEYSDLKFTIDQSKALELLQGANIYKDKFVCIREVIQNAVDSSLIQLWKDIDINKKKNKLEEIKKYNKDIEKKREINAIIDLWEKLEIDEEYKDVLYNNMKKFEEYPIDVYIYIDDKERININIIDKGTGISNKALENMANIGTKKDKRTDKDVIESMPGWLKPSGQFGLGLQSIFLITDKFEIITKADDEPGKRIIFESGKNNKGYITVEANDRNERGTIVKICIDESKINANDIEVDELSLKLKTKSEWIMEFIINKARQNQFIGECDDYNNKSNINMKNYFKIDINKIDKHTKNEEKIITNECLFTDKDLLKSLSKNGEFIISEAKNNLSYIYFDHEFNYLCKVEFKKPRIYERKGQKILRNFENEELDFFSPGYIFFKNVFVCKMDLDTYSDFRSRIFRFFRFSLNMLDYKADDLLEINRNSIKDNYRNQFMNILVKVLKKLFQSMHDYILNNPISSMNEYLIIIYQLLCGFDINTYKFEDKCKSSMEKFSYEIDLDADEEFSKVVSFEGLLDYTIKALYPVSEDSIKYRISDIKYLELIDKDVIKEIRTDDKTILNAFFLGDSIILGRLIEAKVVQLNNEIYYFREYGFLATSSRQFLPQYDEMYLIKEFINITKNKQLNMIPLKNFEKLVVESVDKGSIRHIIKLPFNYNHYERVINSINENKCEDFDKDAFKKDVLNTQYFNCLIKYVSDKRNLETNIVIQLYDVLIDEYLKLLITSEGNPYKKFVKALLNDNEED